MGLSIHYNSLTQLILVLRFGNSSLSIRDDKSSVKMGSSSGVKIEYQARSDPTDPNDVPVTIVGLASHLAGMATLILNFPLSFPSTKILSF